jgi:hypothetical protein
MGGNAPTTSQTKMDKGNTPPPPEMPAVGLPPLRSLDLANMTRKEQVYDELDHTVESLGRWLDVIGAGLARVLTAPPPASS